MSARYVALATATSIGKEDFDDPPLRAALTAAGVTARVLAWDDPEDQAALRGAALCVIRSTWNYVRQHERFVSWVEELSRATALWNPAPVIRWNSHKGYLLELAAQGIPVVPTRLLPQGSTQPLAEVMGEWSDVVVKPAVGAGSFATLRVRPGELLAGEAHLRTLVGERDALVQLFQPAVEGTGERSLVWIDGAFTHAIRKNPRFIGQQEHVSEQSVPIADDERALAEKILSLVPHPLLYARVDLVRDDSGRPQLMELELIEPSLFFAQQPRAAERMAAAISRLVATTALSSPPGGSST